MQQRAEQLVTRIFDGASQEKETTPITDISRRTDELVIGLVGAVGAGVSKTARILEAVLVEEYGYEAKVIRASDIIRSHSSSTNVQTPAEQGADRIIDLQKVGKELRAKFGEDYIAAKIIEQIAVRRKAEGGYDSSTQVPQPKSQRHVTIVDSLKHPAESALFRKVYGEIYWQITVFAPESVRDERLRRIGIPKEKLPGIFTRDENDKEGDFGQKVSKTAYLSDFFIRNDGENDLRLTTVVKRYLEILFNIGIHTPTMDEAGMYAAVSASSKSACLSRQVGAAIYSRSGELISIGWNDVPQAGGGLYAAECGDQDHRCYRWGGKYCHNSHKKEDLYKKILSKLKIKNLIDESISEAEFRAAVVETPVKDLIEYSRSIHAEMEAIVSAARTGKAGMVGGTLYTTTFPCHNCARHIVAAGISRVLYVEPYEKSLALELHGDAITTQEDGKKVAFLQYEGVGPGSMLKLFHHGTDRKNSDGTVHIADKRSAVPIMAPPMDGFTTHEKRVIAHLESIEGDLGQGVGGTQ